MRKKNAKIVFIWIMLILLIVGQTSVVFAGKPQKPTEPTEPPVVSSAIDITTQDLTFELLENGTVNFSVNATLKKALNVIWSTNAIDDSQLKLINVNKTKVGKRTVTYYEEAKYTFTPSNTNSEKWYEFTIIASSDDVNYDSITVKFHVNGVFVYVALGDSIPNGVSYDPSYSTTPIESYTDKFFNYLKPTQVNPIYTDYSISGFNTIDVLNQLNDINKQQAIRTADIITLCVGANDIMDAADRDWLGIIDFYDVNLNIANTGRMNFQLNWPLVIQKIHALNPGVKLLVTTIYNPYNISDYKTNTNTSFLDPNTPIRSIVDRYLLSEQPDTLGLNTIIFNYAAMNPTHYKVVDIYSYFEAMYGDNKGAVTGFYDNWVKDPHPDREGQTVIFEQHTTVYDMYEEY